MINAGRTQPKLSFASGITFTIVSKLPLSKIKLKKSGIQTQTPEEVE